MTTVKCDKDLFCGVNVVKDSERMTDLEKKHLPIITAPASCVPSPTVTCTASGKVRQKLK